MKLVVPSDGPIYCLSFAASNAGSSKPESLPRGPLYTTKRTTFRRKMPQAGSVMRRLGALRRKIILEVLDLAQPLHDVRHLFGCSGCSG